MPGKRVARALAVLPRELRQLTELFLMPEDHPFSLERCAAIVKEDREQLPSRDQDRVEPCLARHYGYWSGSAERGRIWSSGPIRAKCAASTSEPPDGVETRGDQGGKTASKAVEPPLCKCGRGPWRKGQRNCHVCNREANAKYRA